MKTEITGLEEFKAIGVRKVVLYYAGNGEPRDSFIVYFGNGTMLSFDVPVGHEHRDCHPQISDGTKGWSSLL